MEFLEFAKNYQFYFLFYSILIVVGLLILLLGILLFMRLLPFLERFYHFFRRGVSICYHSMIESLERFFLFLLREISRCGHLIFDYLEIGYHHIRCLIVTPTRHLYFHHSIEFFGSNANLIAIIGAIATIISLSPLFLTLIVGDEWFRILLTTSPGFEALKAIITATIFAAFFIYCIIALIIIQWVNEIFRNDQIRTGEKLFSFAILLSGIITILYLVYFLLFVWFSRSSILLSILGLNTLLFIIALALIFCISGFWDITSEIPTFSIRKIFSIGILLFLLIGIAILVLPAITNTQSISTIISNYTQPKNYTVTFQPIKNQTDNATPGFILIQTNFSNYQDTDIDLDYANCHWSTNYGYFFTINSESLFIKRYSN